MIPVNDRIVGQLYAVVDRANSLVYCLSGDKDNANLIVLWPGRFRDGTIPWSFLRPVTDVYPSKHEIMKMIMGDMKAKL